MATQGLLNPDGGEQGLLGSIGNALSRMSPATQGLLATGFGLLAGRGSRANVIGQAGLAGLSAYGGAQDDELRRRYMQQQMDASAANAELTKARTQKTTALMDNLQRWMGPMAGVQDANASTIAQTGNLAPTVGNARIQGDALRQVRGADPLYGIPREALQADLTFNDGKGIAEMLFKRGTPNIDFVNGVAVDKSTVRPGFSVPTVSQDGRASQVLQDPTAPNGFRVVAPPGAMETYGAYRGIDERAKAALDPLKVYNPDTRREEYVPRTDVVGSGGGAAPAGGVPGLPAPLRNNNPGALMPGGKMAQFATPEEGLRAMDANLQAYAGRGINTLRGVISRWAPPSENNTEAYIAAASQRLGLKPDQQIDLGNPVVRHALSTALMLHENGPAGVFGAGQPQPSRPQRYAAGPSSLESAQGKYDEEVQRDFAARRKSIFDAGEVAGGRINDYQRLGQLLAQHDGGALSPKGLEIAKTLNSLGMNVDPFLPNKEAATSLANKMALDLRNPAGGAGMPGAMSDSDRQFLQQMVPNLTTSAEGRRLMVSYAVAIEQRKQQVAQFARNFEGKHGRLDNEFYDQLTAWSKANPLFKQAQKPQSRGATGAW